MKTHRELRPYKKLDKILQMIRPLIEAYELQTSEAHVEIQQ